MYLALSYSYCYYISSALILVLLHFYTRLQVFCHLPLCAVLENEVFIVHAGIPSDEESTIYHIGAVARSNITTTVAAKWSQVLSLLAFLVQKYKYCRSYGAARAAEYSSSG